ncbi:MAG: hypothetical protein A2527_13145 [Candidatus Lambdaproteobacteria bacterium RIFOXYD2_FULL_50_16]|uniref:Histidine kinase n=1 Tax=Candidatus Lambdaproteobacteria bacterium RIFOXYD2_FULL_50_16 TaxID=1817772 RepID=A0A1F6GG53_9PROT|nr:MAG: hypothetical protein A2527_13145 [Candidatus Lambdaproteobacteria bacterium RIFOXYD2_FULL_50_16]
MKIKNWLPLLVFILGLGFIYGQYYQQLAQRDNMVQKGAQEQLALGAARFETGLKALNQSLHINVRLAENTQSALDAEGLFKELKANGLAVEQVLWVERWEEADRAKQLKELTKINKDFALRLSPEQLKNREFYLPVTGSYPNISEQGRDLALLEPLVALLERVQLEGQPKLYDKDFKDAFGAGLWMAVPQSQKKHWFLIKLDAKELSKTLSQGHPEGMGYRLGLKGDRLWTAQSALGQGHLVELGLETPLLGQQVSLLFTAYQQPVPTLGNEVDIALLIFGFLWTLGAAFSIRYFADGLEKALAQSEARKRRLEFYQTGLEKVQAKAGIENALRAALSAISTYANWPLAHTALPDESGHKVETAFWHQTEPGSFSSFIEAAESKNFQSGEGLVDRVLANEKLVWIEDISADASFSRTKIHYDFGVKTAVGFPVFSGGEIVTVLEFFSADQQAWDQERIDAIAPLITQLGAALEGHWADSRQETLRARLGALISQLDQPLLLFDQNGQMIEGNPAAEQFFGYKTKELRGRPLTLLIADQDQLKEQLVQIIIGEPRWPQTKAIKARRKDGRAESANVLFGRLESGPAGLYFARFSLDQAPMEARPTVAQTISKGYEEQERSARQNRLGTDYFSSLGQSLKLPATALVNLARNLAQETGAPEQAQILNTLVKTSQSLEKTLSRAIELARAESGRLVLRQQPFDLRKLVERVLEAYFHKATTKGLELVSYIGTEVPVALIGDPDRLFRLLSILVENAVDYTSRGEVVLELSAISQSVEIVELSFKVRDSGLGLSEAKQTELANQLSGLIKGGKEGAQHALGVRLAGALAGLMGGGLRFSGIEGQGSSFGFSARLGRQPEPRETGMRAVRNLSGVRVLLIEPNLSLGQVLQKYLLYWGAQPSLCASLAEAQKLVGGRRNPTDLIILDQSFGHDRLDQLRELRKTLPGLPVILTSNLDGSMVIPENEDLEPIARLNKPIKSLELYPLMLRLLGRNDEAAGAREPKAKVLLVEDKKEEVQLLVQALKAASWQVTLAQSAKEAMEARANNEFRLTLVDLSLPGTDGLELITMLRRWEEENLGYLLPLIALADRGEGGRKQAAYQAGADLALSKPVDPLYLIELLKSYFYL